MSGRCSTWQHKKPNTAWEASYVATMCTSLFGLPASMSGFLFVPMWGMCMNCILCCKRCEIVGHIPRINYSAMIAVIVYPLAMDASNCTLPVYREHGSIVKCIHLIKGVIRDKTMCLTDEYVLNSEVHLTSRLYDMSRY